MGREYEEGLIRTHQQESPKKKGEATPSLLHDLVKSRITLGGAQGLGNQILKRELQPSGKDIGFLIKK